jgi:hypothetical protein
MQNDKTTPKYVGYVENILQEMKTTNRKPISKVDTKQTLEPKINDVQLSENFSYSAISIQIDRIYILSNL